MKKSELGLTLILVAVLLAGSAYQFYRGGDKTAEVIYLQGNTTPFDENFSSATPTQLLPAPTPTVFDVTGPPGVIVYTTSDDIQPTFFPNTNQARQFRVLAWLNQASTNDLQQIPGIGEQTAKNIIAYRTQQNGFNHINQLSDISGIGDKKQQDIINYIQQNLQSPNKRIPTPQPTTSSSTSTSTNRRISLNKATAEHLESVSNIGPALAKTILEEREKYNKGFRSWNQVRNISGVGKARLELLQQHFTID